MSVSWCILLMCDLFPFNILNFSWNGIGRKTPVISLPAVYKKTFLIIWLLSPTDMAHFSWACILALGLTALLCVLIFLLFYCCEAATLLKIRLMLQDTLVDSRSLCKNWIRDLTSKWFEEGLISQNLKLEKGMEMSVLNNPSKQDSKFCQELYNLSTIFG